MPTLTRQHLSVVRCSLGSYIWISIFIGSTIGGLIPEIWGGDMLSYSGVLLSGVGAVAGLWLGSRASKMIVPTTMVRQRKITFGEMRDGRTK
jgi:hypothetical protein